MPEDKRTLSRRVAILFGLACCFNSGYLVPVFGQKSESLTLSAAQKRAYIAYAYFALDSYFGPAGDFPAAVPAMGEYSTFYVTIMHSGKIRGCQSGRTDREHPQRTKLDIEQAVRRCIEDRRFGGPLQKEEVAGAKLVVNVLFNKRKVQGNLAALKREIELGIHGIEVKQGEKRAFFKESVPIEHDYTLEKTLQRLCRKAKLPEDAWADPKTEIYAYDTLTFQGDREGRTADLYRYNVPLDLQKIDNALIRERVKLAGSWFLHNVKSETGALQYEYYPSLDKYSSEDNHVRQLASLWALTEIEIFMDGAGLSPCIDRMLGYYLSYRVDRDHYAFLTVDGRSTLAFNAFLILALVNRPEYPDRDSLLKSLADGILSLQREDGSYHTDFRSDKTRGIDFYPGEAMLALMKLYRAEGEAKYLQSVKRASPYYRNYWRGNENTAFIPWQTQTHLLLYLETKDPEIPEFAFEMNDWLIDNHQLEQTPFPDKVGAFTRSLPRFSTSAYLEGLNDAYKLAEITGDRAHIRKYRHAIRTATRFLLSTQYTHENSFYLKNPDRAIGGFRFSLESNVQRNDYTQHAVLALIKAYHNQVFPK